MHSSVRVCVGVWFNQVSPLKFALRWKTLKSPPDRTEAFTTETEPKNRTQNQALIRLKSFWASKGV